MSKFEISENPTIENTAALEATVKPAVKQEVAPIKGNTKILKIKINGQEADWYEYKENNSEGLQKRVRETLISLEQEFNLKLSFSPNFHSGEEDSYFLWELVKDGVVIFCRPEPLLKKQDRLKPHALISYSLKDLDESMKKRAQRFIFGKGGGVDKRNRLEYIGQGVILVSMEKAKSIIQFLESNSITYSLTKVWK